jgi:hypothetical protein
MNSYRSHRYIQTFERSLEKLCIHLQVFARKLLIQVLLHSIKPTKKYTHQEQYRHTKMATFYNFFQLHKGLVVYVHTSYHAPEKM